MAKRPIAFVTHLGEPAVMWMSDAFEWSCPVCGTPWPTEEDERNPKHWIQSLDVCTCGTQFGHDDIDEFPPPAEDPIMDRWARLRQAWLDREGWSEEALEQVKNGLGLSREDLLFERAQLGLAPIAE